MIDQGPSQSEAHVQACAVQRFQWALHILTGCQAVV